jgi:hypothetical protein
MIDKYASLDGEKLRQALISDNSDWILTLESFECEELTNACSFKTQTHTGPNNSKFFAFQDTAGYPGSLNLFVYEVKSSNNVKKIFHMKDISSTEA